MLVQPEVEWLLLGGLDGGQALLRSFAPSPRTQAITFEGTGPTRAHAYDERGRLVATVTSGHPGAMGKSTAATVWLTASV